MNQILKKREKNFESHQTSLTERIVVYCIQQKVILFPDVHGTYMTRPTNTPESTKRLQLS